MYRLVRFGTTTLPGKRPREDAATAPTIDGTVGLAGGYAFDAFGSETAPGELPYNLDYDCVATGATAAALRTTLDGLRALRGQRLRLYRQAFSDDSYHWAWARLMQVDAATLPTNSLVKWQPVTLRFKVQSMWYGAAHGGTWTLDSGEYVDTGLYLDENELFTLDTSPKTLSVDNDGNVDQPHVVVTVTAGAAAITYLKVGVAALGWEWEYDGTIAAGEALTVNCGAFTVRNNGQDDYENFALTANHGIAEWVRLAPGENLVVVTKTGGSTDSTVLFEFSDGWA